MKQLINFLFKKIFKSDIFAYHYDNGRKEWFKDGLRHRENGPAIIHKDGAKEWYLNDKPHRIDGPAFESSRKKEWWINGKRHREGGPAVESFSGFREWWINDGLHREDGPAIEEYEHGVLVFTQWYYHGKYVECSSQKQFEKLIKMKAFW